MTKMIALVVVFSISITSVFSQDFGGSKVGIANFVRRMYNTQPFDGVKILQTQQGQDFLISVVQLKKDASRPVNIESRIAGVKAKAFVSQYINGSNISSEVIVVSTETRTKDSVIKKTDMQEVLKESSLGFAIGMELLINFQSQDAKQVVYVYYTEIKK